MELLSLQIGKAMLSHKKYQGIGLMELNGLIALVQYRRKEDFQVGRQNEQCRPKGLSECHVLGVK